MQNRMDEDVGGTEETQAKDGEIKTEVKSD